MARASRVLPVPVGPCNRIPRLGNKPIFLIASGLFQMLIKSSSCLVILPMPPMSAKLTESGECLNFLVDVLDALDSIRSNWVCRLRCSALVTELVIAFIASLISVSTALTSSPTSTRRLLEETDAGSSELSFVCSLPLFVIASCESFTRLIEFGFHCVGAITISFGSCSPKRASSVQRKTKLAQRNCYLKKIKLLYNWRWMKWHTELRLPLLSFFVGSSSLSSLLISMGQSF